MSLVVDTFFRETIVIVGGALVGVADDDSGLV